MAASLRRLPTVPSYRACQKARPTHFDIVLSDAVMPEMDGLMLAAEIHRVRPELPILLLTTHSAPTHATMLRETGVPTVPKKTCPIDGSGDHDRSTARGVSHDPAPWECPRLEPRIRRR